MPDMFSDIVSHREMLEELEREIVLRRRVYPRWIADGKISQARADRQIVVMERVAQIIRRQMGVV